MFRSSIAILMLAVVSGPALSQQPGVSTGSPRYFGNLFFNPDPGIRSSQDTQCLVRRRTGRTECRSIQEWRRLARQIEESRGREPG
jgi:hypothetical protein